MSPTSLDPIHSALLSMDLQSGVVSIYAPNNEELVARAGAVLQHGRRAGLTVIHVKVGFRPGLPEIHPRNMLLGGIKASLKHQQLFEGTSGSIHAAVAPEDGDIVITKSRVNAFAGTDLELVLEPQISTHWFCSALQPAGSYFRRRCTRPTPISDSSSSTIAAPTSTIRCTHV